MLGVGFPDTPETVTESGSGGISTGSGSSGSPRSTTPAKPGMRPWPKPWRLTPRSLMPPEALFQPVRRTKSGRWALRGR